MSKSKSIVSSILFFCALFFPPVFADDAATLKQSVLDIEGLIAFWDFDPNHRNAKGQYIAKSNIESTKDNTNLYPVNIRRKTLHVNQQGEIEYQPDKNDYTPDNFPEEAAQEGKPDIAAGVEAIEDGPLNYAPKLMASRRYFAVRREDFESLPLNIKGEQSFTIVMWVKPINRNKAHHFYAGIWDEDDGNAREGDKQYAVFGGLKFRRHLMLRLSSTGAASFPDYDPHAQEQATDGAEFEVDKWHCFITRYNRDSGFADVFLDGKKTAFSFLWPGVRETYDPGADIAANDEGTKVPQNPLMFNQRIYSPKTARVKLGGFNKVNDYSNCKYSVDAYEMFLDFDLEADRPKAYFGVIDKDHQGKKLTDKSYATQLFGSLSDMPMLDITLEMHTETGGFKGTKTACSISTTNSIIDLSSVMEKDVGEIRITVKDHETGITIGDTINKRLTKGADFTIGAPLAGVSVKNLGTEFYADGVAIYGKVLTDAEMRQLYPTP